MCIENQKGEVVTDIKQAISVLENEVLPVFSYDQTATGENIQEIIKLLKILEEIINTQKEIIASFRYALDAANEKFLYVCGESAPYYSEETGRNFLNAWYKCKTEELKRR